MAAVISFSVRLLPAQAVEHIEGQPIGGIRSAIDSLENYFLAEAGMNKTAK
jgi:hypothetical protein